MDGTGGETDRFGPGDEARPSPSTPATVSRRSAAVKRQWRGVAVVVDAAPARLDPLRAANRPRRARGPGPGPKSAGCAAGGVDGSRFANRDRIEATGRKPPVFASSDSFGTSPIIAG